MARLLFFDHRVPAAADAYHIALDYLEGSGSVRDQDSASTFVAQEISALVDRGERHKIRLANLAICRFERRFHVKQQRDVATS